MGPCSQAGRYKGAICLALGGRAPRTAGYTLHRYLVSIFQAVQAAVSLQLAAEDQVHLGAAGLPACPGPWCTPAAASMPMLAAAANGTCNEGQAARAVMNSSAHGAWPQAATKHVTRKQSQGLSRQPALPSPGPPQGGSQPHGSRILERFVLCGSTASAPPEPAPWKLPPAAGSKRIGLVTQGRPKAMCHQTLKGQHIGRPFPAFHKQGPSA